MKPAKKTRRSRKNITGRVLTRVNYFYSALWPVPDKIHPKQNPRRLIKTNDKSITKRIGLEDFQNIQRYNKFFKS